MANVHVLITISITSSLSVWINLICPIFVSGIIAATRKGLHYLLDSNECKKTGNFVVVVLGGASEALEARPGRYVMVTSRRFGFFKLALQTG